VADERKIERLPGAAVGLEYLAGALMERVKSEELKGFVIIELDKDGYTTSRWTDGMTLAQLCFAAKSFDRAINVLLDDQSESVAEYR